MSVHKLDTFTFKKSILSSALVAATLSTPAFSKNGSINDSFHRATAEDAPAPATTYPSISSELVMELQNEYTPNSNDASREEYNNIFARSELVTTLQLNDNFFIDGVAVFENIQDIEPNKSNYFDNEGVFIEDIKLNYQHGNIALLAGKFNPAYGIAWDFGRGIWTEDFAEDYEMTEKLGVGASYSFGNDKTGMHSLIASTFFADTTFLSGSTITKRDQLNKRDGGTANTEDLSSFAVALEGENLAGIENLYYKLGYRHQAEGDASTDGDDETGYVATLGHIFPVTSRVSMDALVEYTDISNFDTGTADNQYFTANVITTFDDVWIVTLGYTGRDITEAGVADINDHLIEVSGGYDFGQGTTAELGWRGSKEAGSDTDIVGGLIRHTIAF